MSFWWGETLASAVDELGEEIVELCQSTAYATMCGHSRADAPESSFTVAAISEMRPMVRSAIGLRSWSCGGLVVWCRDSSARKARNACDMSLPSRSEWIVRTRGRGSARPCSSTGVPTVALNAAMQRAAAAPASDFCLMNSTKTKRECSSIAKRAYR